MIKHIVFWKLKESANGLTKAKNARLIKEKIEALKDKIPGIITIEVGFDFSQTESSSDVALYSEFATRADLERYQTHPDHMAVVPFITEARSERSVVDYEV